MLEMCKQAGRQADKKAGRQAAKQAGRQEGKCSVRIFPGSVLHGARFLVRVEGVYTARLLGCTLCDGWME